MKTTTRLLALAFMAAWSAQSQEMPAEFILDTEGRLVRSAPIMTNGPLGWVFVSAVEALAVPLVTDSTRAPAGTNSPGFPEAKTSVLNRRIELIPGGARADYGLLKVSFPADIGGADPVSVQTADGRKLAFRPTFLALRDTVSGESRLLGQVTNRIGLVVSTNWVVYTNAFSGIRADLRFRYSGGPDGGHSLEQDVLLLESPAIGEFSPTNARVEVWSEWYNSAPSSKETQALDLRAKADEGTAEPAVVSDENITFGSARIGAGHAFSASDESDKIPVGKLWGRIENRDWLIETVDYLELKMKLEGLPVRQAALPQDGKSHAGPRSLIRSLKTPARDLKEDRSMQLVSTDPSSKDTVVLDFVIVSSVPVPAGIVSWWPAGGNANDAITNNHGTLYNGGTYAAGKVGQAFKFDGNNDHVRIPNQANLRFTNAMTFEGWVYPTNTSYYREIFSKWDAVGGYNQRSFDCSLYPGGRFYILVSPGGTDTGATFILTTNAAPLDSWTHVAATYDGATLKVYFNGVLENQGTYSNGIFPGTNTLGIGAATGGVAPGSMVTPFPGMIDEPSLYSRALSAAEIAAIYNAGVAGKYNPTCITASTNIVGWWPGDGNIYDFARTNFAALKNGATYGAAVASHGFSFDGSDDYLEITNAPDLNPTNAITLEAWVYQISGQYQNAPIVSKDNPAAARQYLLSVSDSGKFRAHVWTTVTGLAYFDSIADVQLGGWYHLAMTYNGTNLILYVNGVQDRSAIVSGKIVTGSDPLRIGGSYSGSWGNYKFNGLIDEPTIYNRALSGAEISALYAAGTAGKCKIDTDGDGLTDLQESFWGTNPNNVDTDYDGRSDGQEVLDGTSPTNPSSLTPVRLGYWRFDNTDTWIGDQGQTPLSAVNLRGVKSWSTNAIEVDEQDDASIRYRDVEANANSNINLRKGSVRFWFKPNWSSTTAGGTGPQTWASLIEVGYSTQDATYGQWIITTDPDGKEIWLMTQADGVGTVHFTKSINWIENSWHEIVLTYSASSVSLYLDGSPAVANAPGVVHYPNASVRSQGFTIGGRGWGNALSKGQFDDLETFNYTLSAQQIADNYNAMLARDSDGDGRTDWAETIENTDPTDPNSKASGPIFADSPVSAAGGEQVGGCPTLIVWAQGGTDWLKIEGGDPNQYYDLYGTPDLIAPMVVIKQVRGGSDYQLIDPNYSHYYYQLDGDGDGLRDDLELFAYGTEPCNPDTDGDGISDGDEVFIYGTDPRIANSAIPTTISVQKCPL